MIDIVVVGGGPAGLTAAIYACRAGKSVLIIEKNGFGGQITWSPRVENFPSEAAVSGNELGDKLTGRALELGADAELDEVIGVEDRGRCKVVRCESGAEYECKAVIIAAGAKPRALGLPEEAKLLGSGVGFCAVCDGAFYKGRPVAVTGGGNSALQDAVLLSEICSRVYLIHRRDRFRGEAKLVEALQAKENVEFVLNASVTGLEGEEALEAITVVQNGEERRIEADGLFVAIGHEPDLGNFSSLLRLDGNGYADSSEDCISITQGVFVAGDCRRKQVRQLTTAMADGSVAALAACNYIDTVL